jgi:propionyl-CoA synthetase
MAGAGARNRGVRGVSVRDYEAFYRRSIEDPEGFWAEQARKIHWNTDWDEVLDYGDPPFARWFVGGETKLCYNAVDRHLRARGPGRPGLHIHRDGGARHVHLR